MRQRAERRRADGSGGTAVARRPWHRWGVAAGVLAAALAAGCTSGADDGVREVLVDYVHDEVAGSFLTYFPREVTVRPGDTVRFRQEWTGEPHSVTMGTIVDEMMGTFLPLYEEYKDVDFPDLPPEVIETIDELDAMLPYMAPDDLEGGPVNQNVAQPCYLDEGGPPEDPMTPCSDEEQQQPAFNGRQSFYNSGFIDYRSEDSNVFEVTLADDIAPGTYYYYCNFHGFFQNGAINVVGADEEIPSQDEVSRQAKAEIDAMAAPLIAALDEVQAATTDGGSVSLQGFEIPPPLAGWFVDDPDINAFISEFVPAQSRVAVGDTVTWAFVGLHTVSFNPPDYFSELTVEDDGTVIFSPDALQPRGGPGMPEPPPGEEGEGGPPPEGEGGEGEGGPPPGSEGPPDPPLIEVGEWDGSGFLSSGVVDEAFYAVTFTQPGTYRYACLIHPQMVGTVVVEEG